MRTIAEIKDSIAADFMRNEAVRNAYKFPEESVFSDYFSKVSIESMLFYVFATAAWVIENLFDQHRRDVETLLEEKIPHRPKWYRDKVMNFMEGKMLVLDTDRYDTSGMTEDEIAGKRVVKYVSVTENVSSSMLNIKVAGETNKKRGPLSSGTEIQLATYINEIKDAGVRINLVNIEAQTFGCKVAVYYSGMMEASEKDKPGTRVENLCIAAIKHYIENLPFNGEYTNMGLVDVLQQVEGVKVVDGLEATVNGAPINARCSPDAGYFVPGEIKVNPIPYEPV